MVLRERKELGCPVQERDNPTTVQIQRSNQKHRSPEPNYSLNKEGHESRRREGIDRMELIPVQKRIQGILMKGLWIWTWRNITGEPGSGPRSKKVHCREKWKLLANRFEGLWVQHPLGGNGSLPGTLVCNHIQLAWDVDRNKGNVLSMTKQNQNPSGCVPRRGMKRTHPSQTV